MGNEGRGSLKQCGIFKHRPYKRRLVNRSRAPDECLPHYDAGILQPRVSAARVTCCLLSRTLDLDRVNTELEFFKFLRERQIQMMRSWVSGFVEWTGASSTDRLVNLKLWYATTTARHLARKRRLDGKQTVAGRQIAGAPAVSCVNMTTPAGS